MAAPKVVPVCTTNCPHLYLWVDDAHGGTTYCRACGRVWERLDEVPDCTHPALDHGRCVRCGWLKERPMPGGCRHPLATPQEAPHDFACPHCAGVTDGARNGLRRGHFTCADPETHRADWDGMGCPRCWTPPTPPARTVTHDDFPPRGVRVRVEDTGWTLAEGYRLLPRCASTRHDHLDAHHSTACALTGLLVTLPKGLPHGEVAWSYDGEGRITGVADGSLPLLDEAVAALAEAHHLPVAPTLAGKLTEMRKRAALERTRLDCPHDGGWNRTEGRGKRALILCKVCGADMSHDGGYV